VIIARRILGDTQRLAVCLAGPDPLGDGVLLLLLLLLLLLWRVGRSRRVVIRKGLHFSYISYISYTACVIRARSSYTSYTSCYTSVTSSYTIYTILGCFTRASVAGVAGVATLQNFSNSNWLTPASPRREPDIPTTSPQVRREA